MGDQKADQGKSSKSEGKGQEAKQGLSSQGKGQEAKQSFSSQGKTDPNSLAPLNLEQQLPDEFGYYNTPKLGRVVDIGTNLINTAVSYGLPNYGLATGAVSAGLDASEQIADMLGLEGLGSGLGAFGDIVSNPFRAIGRAFTGAVKKGESDPDPIGYLGGLVGLGQGTYQTDTDPGHNLANIGRDLLGGASMLGGFSSIDQALSPLGFLGGNIAQGLGLVSDITGESLFGKLANLTGGLTSAYGIGNTLIDALSGQGLFGEDGLFNGTAGAPDASTVSSMVNGVTNSKLPAGNKTYSGGWLGSDGRYYTPQETQVLEGSSTSPIGASGEVIPPTGQSALLKYLLEILANQ
jgi:hypothetical protein